MVRLHILKTNKTNWIFEITPTYLISFVDLCSFLQHGDRQQHLVGGRDHASWNVFSQRLKVNRRSCSCSRTHRDSCLPIGSVNVFPLPELWSTPSLMDSPLSTPRHPSQRPSDIIVMLVMGLLFFHGFVNASLWLVYLWDFVKSTELCHTVCFHPLKGFLGSWKDLLCFTFCFPAWRSARMLSATYRQKKLENVFSFAVIR